MFLDYPTNRPVASALYPGLSGTSFGASSLSSVGTAAPRVAAALISGGVSEVALQQLAKTPRAPGVDYALLAREDQTGATPILDSVDNALIDIAAFVAEQSEASSGLATSPAILGVIARAKAIVGAVASRSVSIRAALLNPSSASPTWAAAQQAQSLASYALPALEQVKRDLVAGVEGARREGEARNQAAQQAQAAAQAAAAQAAAAQHAEAARRAAANQVVDQAFNQARTFAAQGIYDGALVAIQNPSVIGAAQATGREGELTAVLTEVLAGQQRTKAAEEAVQQQMSACLNRGGTWNGQWCETVAQSPVVRAETIQDAVARWTAAFQNQARLRASLSTSVPGGASAPAVAPVAGGYDFNARSYDSDGGF